MFTQKDAIDLIKTNKFKKFSEELLKDNIVSIFIYGSVAYNCKESFDDLDLIVITKEVTTQILKVEYDKFQIDYNVYSEHDFNILLNIHDFGAIECLFLPQEFYIGEKPAFSLNKQTLRHSVSALVSNSFVKSKKKFQEQDYYKGKKSLWHSLRILSFAIDVVTYNQIQFESFNFLYNEIVNNPSENYEDYQNYKKLYNSLSSEFKKIAPK